MVICFSKVKGNKALKPHASRGNVCFGIIMLCEELPASDRLIRDDVT